MVRATLMLILMVLFCSACESEECKTMRACCAAVGDAEWVGDSCGEMAASVKDPQTCRTITRTVRAALEQRSEPVPNACQ